MLNQARRILSERRLVLLRRVSQAGFFLFFIYVLWSTTYPLAGKFSPNIIFAVDPLVMFITALSERTLLPKMGAAAAMLALTVLLGRFFCGWICPLGFCVDLGARLARNRPRSFVPFRRLRTLKFYLLGLLALLAVAGVQLAWVLDPIVIAARFVSLNLIPGLVMVTDRSLAWIMRTFGLYGALLDVYRWMKEGALGVNAYVFMHSAVILAIFAAIVGAGMFHRRLWCRVLCPLGALYALTARFSLLRRVVRGCVECGVCREECRMAAISDGPEYDPGECVLCMDCVYDCAPADTGFSFRRPACKAAEENDPKGISRREFLSLAGATVPAVALPGFRPPVPLRPPGAIPEAEFLDRCIRCGNCMKVCLTNGLQPAMLEAGLRGLWTPRLVPRIGYCEYNCTLCGQVCPVGALKELTQKEKHKFKMGLAWINRDLCLPWKKEEECIVCEEHCPVPEKAIKLEPVPGKKNLRRPCVDRELCTGCGICEHKCPLRPDRAVRVYPRSVELPDPGPCGEGSRVRNLLGKPADGGAPERSADQYPY